MDITLLGTGDSTGTPTVGCRCETCQAAIAKDIERTRFSVHIANDRTNEVLLIDASPDFRTQFLTNDLQLPDAVIITHLHFDHLHGLGNAYRVFDTLSVYAADETDPVTGESVAETIQSRYEYLDTVSITGIEPQQTARICGLDITLVPVDHPPLACYGVTVTDPSTGGRLALTGDTTYAIPDPSRSTLANADLLLADAIVPARFCEQHPAGGNHHNSAGIPRTFGTKHLTREGALDLAEELRAKQTRLVHASHFYPPEEAFAEPLAIDGEQYHL